MEVVGETCSVKLGIRARTAIERYDFSRPVKLALKDLVITKEKTVFDYGCGRGADVEFLNGLGVKTSGWDPHYRSDASKTEADVVNLGYVINVIEDPGERIRVIKDAFRHAGECLVIAAQHKKAAVTGVAEKGDGIITSRETFQKYYSQEELKELVQSTLGVTPYSAGPCIVYAFKCDEARLNYLENKYDSTKLLMPVHVPFRKNRPTPVAKVSVKKKRIEELNDSSVARSLVDWVTARGRMPVGLEFEDISGLSERGLSQKGLEAWVFENVDKERFQTARDIRKRDILLFLALTRLDPSGRPKFSKLPKKMALDIKTFFGSYQKASEESDKLLFSIAQPEIIASAINQSLIGKKLPDSLYVHSTAIPYLPDALQIFIACGKTLVGDIDGDVIVKIPKKGESVSFLLYKGFDELDHPELVLSIQANFRIQKTFVRDYSQSDNPPILHRKETFVHPSYPLYNLFTQITKKEEALGLLSRSDIGFKKGWHKVLSSL